ncbi:MAG: glutamine synthetase beta-grasp domain-containing protein [Abditibacteriota bacterium]|nr:glutamine synthetase beta-grasp domain-containing protein [Abditibacteriota bacterium]
MNQTEKDVLTFVNENDVKFIRLAFCDLKGNMKNISIMPNELENAFDRGIAVKGNYIFDTEEEIDLFLFPDAATLHILPWRPQEGRVMRLFCYIKEREGNISPFDCRHILKEKISVIDDLGLKIKVGFECPFALYNSREEKIPIDFATYLDVAPFDKGENIRREICLSMEKMGIYPKGSFHQKAPGQNEIDFESDLDSACDNFVVFKNLIYVIAWRSGLYADLEEEPFVLNIEIENEYIKKQFKKDSLNMFKKLINNTLKEVDKYSLDVAYLDKKLTIKTSFDYNINIFMVLPLILSCCIDIIKQRSPQERKKRSGKSSD